MNEQVRGTALTTAAAANIVPLKAGNAVQAFVPTTYDEAWRMSQGIVQGGFNPPSLKTPQAVMQAIIYGLEVGMKPFMALKNIAIINGRPAVYGDAIPGLVYASGLCEFIEVKFEGEGDNLTATCTTQRKGAPRPVSDQFSVADAKKAGVWGKSGPWSQYPRRMLGIRARSFILRDTYADIIGGINTVEEVMDLPEDEYRDVTPPSVPPAPADEEESAAPIARKPRAKRNASAQQPAGEQPAAEDATPPSAVPTIEAEATAEEAADVPPAVEDSDASDEQIDPEVFTAEFRQMLAADQSLDDIGATYDAHARTIRGLPPEWRNACDEAYRLRSEEIRGETAEARKARLRPAYDDGIASFYRGRKRTLGPPAAFKDGGEFEKTWLKGYERAESGQEANPQAPAAAPEPPPVAEEAPPPVIASGSAADDVLLDAAYEAGREAQKKGMSKRAVPGEYRDPARLAEADAWRQGYEDSAREG